MTNEEKNIITNLSKCDFTQMSQYFKAQTEARKQMSKEEKLVLQNLLNLWRILESWLVHLIFFLVLTTQH